MIENFEHTGFNFFHLQKMALTLEDYKNWNCRTGLQSANLCRIANPTNISKMGKDWLHYYQSNFISQLRSVPAFFKLNTLSKVGVSVDYITIPALHRLELFWVLTRLTGVATHSLAGLKLNGGKSILKVLIILHRSLSIMRHPVTHKPRPIERRLDSTLFLLQSYFRLGRSLIKIHNHFSRYQKENNLTLFYATF